MFNALITLSDATLRAMQADLTIFIATHWALDSPELTDEEEALLIVINSELEERGIADAEIAAYGDVCGCMHQDCTECWSPSILTNVVEPLCIDEPPF